MASELRIKYDTLGLQRVSARWWEQISVIKDMPCFLDRSWKVISDDDSYYGQGPWFKFFKEVKVSCGPARFDYF